MNSVSVHPAAVEHLPSFITAPGQTDVLMVVTSIILLGSVLGFGVLFFHLHTLPERIAHKSEKLQFEIVAVLGLISLFTHMHIFWVIGLLLALVDIPDFGGWLNRIARSVEKIAGIPSPAQSERSVRESEGHSSHADKSHHKEESMAASKKPIGAGHA